jgi:hypothetical protein
MVQLFTPQTSGVMTFQQPDSFGTRQEQRRRNMRILMVLTSHDTLGNTGRKTGFWLEEFAAPYFVFRDAGVKLTLGR